VAGTLISTERGEIRVEDLREGDNLQTVIRGQQQTIVWIGHRRISCNRHPEPEKVWPVRISANAFGSGLPRRDLWVSPDHAIYVGDSLIPVKYLINDKTIAQQPIDEVEYYHVELARHDLVLSEGLPTESYLDTGDREKFNCAGIRISLYPDFFAPLYPDQSSLIWEAKGCAPLVVTGPEVVAARKLLEANLPKRKTRRKKARVTTAISPVGDTSVSPIRPKQRRRGTNR
jgi:hypothetical protein